MGLVLVKRIIVAVVILLGLWLGLNALERWAGPPDDEPASEALGEGG